MRTFYDFSDYAEIPGWLVSYMLSVADADNIAEIPLWEINSFLNGLEENERAFGE